ncbi:MAG: Gfo/Idh/MocA family oxidoreductase [Bacteroidales bacterium]|nr:Gfo/Idh/MocA family oxidoreductase [Bacteroidales bacterium]
MLNIGLLGADLTGKQHAQAIQTVNSLRLSGIFSPETEEAKKLAHELGVPIFSSPQELMQVSDALDITLSDDSLLPMIPAFVKASRHLFINPYFFKSLLLGENLWKLAQEAKVKVQVGCIERFHSALLTARPFIDNPVFIEAQHGVPYLPEFAGKSVVEELMNRDIDIILSLINANIKRVHATGINVFGDTPDIVNAHLEFDNGTTVNLTANRIAGENIRRFQFYKHYSRVETDLIHPSTHIFEKKNDQFSVKELNTPPNRPLTEALNAFYQSIFYNSEPPVGISEICQAQKITHMISDKIEMISKAG